MSLAPIANESIEDPKWITKTAFPHPRRKLGMLCLLWLVSGRSSSLDYSVDSKILTDNGLTWNGEVRRGLEALLEQNATQKASNISELLARHEFLSPQFESMRMALRFVWRVAEVEFTDASKNNSAERKGKRRFPKRLCFTSAMDLLEVSFDRATIIRVSIKWAFPELTLISPVETEEEERFTRWFSLQAEPTVFMLRDSETPLPGQFDQTSVYEQILSEGQFQVPAGDQTGPTRVLRAAWSDGLNPDIVYSSRTRDVIFAEHVDSDEFTAYVNRVRLANRINTDTFQIRIPNNDSDSFTAEFEEVDTNVALNLTPSQFPHNRMLSGAPGTGKSYRLALDAKTLDATVIRTVFYSGLRHSAFFGSLRPLTTDEGQISYTFQPGPFIRAYVAANRNPNKHVVLVIEELNRADVSEVFGEVFQLLDRNQDGSSEYSVAVSSDCSRYLRVELNRAEPVDEISLPPNLSIWSTINPADQSVNTLDSAFIRRWSRQYIHIDEGELAAGGLVLRLPFADRDIQWNELRRALNAYMMKIDPHLSEDKLLGPFFVTPKDLTVSGSLDIFLNKLMNYLINDALRFKRSELFDGMFVRNFSDFLSRYDSNPDFKAWFNKLLDISEVA